MAGFRVAVLADAHFHDPEGDFGVGIMAEGRRYAWRSWADTEAGPRAVNESKAALTAALDRVAAAGVRHVVLAGDYTDDGQAETTRCLAALLAEYREMHGLEFHAIIGNHDAWGLAGKHVSTRYATAPRQTALVTSDPALARTEGAAPCPQMRCAGLPEALAPMAPFGPFRRPGDVHWESPFGASDRVEDRLFTAAAADGSVNCRMMDTSCLREPEPGLWLLLLDATVFEPRPGRTGPVERDPGQPDPVRKRAFLDPADAGWNAVLRVKPFLLPWIADVTARAVRLGKALVAVSHYPVRDPFAAEQGAEAALFGATPLARRMPGPQVAQALEGAGLRFHIGGHLHVNSETRSTGAGGLTDVSLPSLVAFPPGFAILTANAQTVRVAPQSLADLPPDPTLAVFYASEGRAGPPLALGAQLAAQFRARVTRRLRPLGHLDGPQGQRLGESLAVLGADREALAQATGCTVADLEALALDDLIADALMLREAGAPAVAVLAQGRLALCRALAQALGEEEADPASSTRAALARFFALLRIALARLDDPAQAGRDNPPVLP